ncbi:hypothetical protein L1987_59507 [Smallanthus sonchifolius]|uniref:Uncharacterized protein n=1 Tax=Smallanthus sonchifolius TaxID=185202 RepID=A0ACB9D5G5_9ASTR|nr:hypothetical protein L1987_59507 [Smallanthus sonchifolius]
MDSLSFMFQAVVTSNIDSARHSEIQSRSLTIGGATSRNVRITSTLNNRRLVSVQARALEESEWLRVTLHKWLDDEYCPEPTNVDICNVAARSYYKSLIENQTDLGDILLRMAMELETISYQESFHGAFSSANAAVNLILQRILHE